MKRYLLAASALLIGTSAYALAADEDKTIDASQQAVSEPAKLADQAAYAGWDKPLAEPKLTDASFAAWDEPEAKLEKVMLADATDPIVQSKLALASANAVEKDQTGMGGPLEEADATATGLTPRPAAHNYPPCDPGPGDDNCIQLYESGVRAQLASWNRPTGGLIDHDSATAMGGPYEPADSVALDKPDVAEAELASVYKPEPVDDVAMGGPYEPVDEADLKPATVAETELASVYKPVYAESDLAHHVAGDGMGGPVEAQSGYPPCEPGPGDDRCIQLYEPGVTGAGN